MKFFRIIFVFLVVTLSGCTTMVYNLDMPAGMEKGTVHVYRMYASPTAWNLNLAIDGEKVASIAQKSTVKFNVAVGERNLSIDWPLLAGGLNIDGNYKILPNQDHYFVIGGDFKINVFIYTNRLQLSQLTKQQWDDLATAKLKKEQAER